MSFEAPPPPRGKKQMKKDLEDRQRGESNTNKWNLSSTTLESMAENDRKVKAGLLPKYIGGDVNTPTQFEKDCEKVRRFVSILKEGSR